MHSVEYGEGMSDQAMSPTQWQSSPEWGRVMHRMSGRRDELVERFIALFPVDDRYGPNVLSEDDVQQVVAETMDLFLLVLAGEEPGQYLRGVPERLGSRRHRQGIDLELLIAGVRTTFRVLWQALREEAEADEPELLLGRVDGLLEMVERHVATVQHAYLREEERMSRDSQRAIERTLSYFLGSTEPSPAELREVAGALGASLGAEYRLAVLYSRGHEELLAAGPLLERWPFRADRAGVLCAFQLREEPFDPNGLAEYFSGCFTEQPVWLEEIPELSRAMIRLAQPLRLDGRGVVSFDEATLAFARTTATEHMPRPTLQLGHAFAEIPEGERERLVETLSAWFRSGTIKETAASLRCHRNTVVARLARFRELTGYDVAVPRDLSIVALALPL
ncbi:helix-turn-helix domain-containing protein [Leucobacter sp. M11]|uniref:helix-turn-helix domain-containing protein n=1 Tax=Leucobacter sp. M11 TaxID=2993565 RepID=UPI002D80A598|nr:helix-turn-helix domain-containing protein [Leucobacter sp. M11]MEB4616421.1 helix-turn-helix domain-containing protein [Leucobacter sp. M11]